MVPKGRKWRRRLDNFQQKIWDEIHEAIKKVCLERGWIPSIRDLHRRTGYSETTIHKHVKGIREDRSFMEQLELKNLVERIRTMNGHKGPGEKLHICYEGPGGWIFQGHDQSMPIILLGEKKLYEGTSSESPRDLFNLLVSGLVRSQLQSAFLGTLLEDPINREQVELFMQYDESEEVSNKEYENVLRALIPPGRAFIIYSFDTELLMETLKSLWKDRKQRVFPAEDLRDLERRLERKEMR